MGSRGNDILYDLPDEGIDECPVSYITPESKTLVEILTGSSVIFKHAGSPSLGDPSEWPATLIDAATIFEVCNSKREAEMHDVIDRNRQQ